MSDSNLFTQFLDELKISNVSDISTKYENITTRLNKDFWDSDSATAHSLQIGSYGRRTAIDGVSDLDMVFELPQDDYDRYRRLAGNGPSVMLQEVRASLLRRYPESEVRADGQIVAVMFSGYRVEVLPAFPDGDGNYTHGDTNDGGSWDLTKPRPEIRAVNALNEQTQGTLKDCCKMLRAWKNQVGVSIGGLLIDTLVYNYFLAHPERHGDGYKDYPKLLVSLFSDLANQSPSQAYWLAPGSGQRVKRKGAFEAKAKKAATRCQEAVDAADEAARARIWRKIFGRTFPTAVALVESAANPFDKEEFIEDRFPVDICYHLRVDCEVREGNTLKDLLRNALRRKERVPIGRHLQFRVAECDVPGRFEVWWKIRNQGPEALSRKMLRGEIVRDKDGERQRYERSDFTGDHYVEAYAIKDGICVARDRIRVPI